MRKQTAYLIALLLLCTTSSIAQIQEYIQTYLSIAQEESFRSNIPASIILGQGLLESNNGNSELARNSNNHFGIKCKEDWQGQKYFHFDDDKDENGNLIKSCFRVYASVEDSYKDHSDFLRNRGFYDRLFELGKTDYTNWAIGLKECGYATDEIYAEKLIRIIEKNELHRFDSPALLMVMEAPVYHIPAEFLRKIELVDPYIYEETEQQVITPSYSSTENSITEVSRFDYEVVVEEVQVEQVPYEEESIEIAETPIREAEVTLYEQIQNIRNKPLMEEVELDYIVTDIIPNTSSKDKEIQNLSRKPRVSGGQGPR